jgi:hypothetical protein
MGVIEQVSRYDAHVNEVRMARMKQFATRSERARSRDTSVPLRRTRRPRRRSRWRGRRRRWQADGLVDSAIDAELAADALGSMVGRFSELWLVQRYRQYDFDHAVEQLTRLWANALGLDDDSGRGG